MRWAKLSKTLDIVSAVRGGYHLPIEWYPVQLTHGDNHAIVWVNRQPLQLGEPDDWCYAPVSAKQLDEICSVLNVHPVTSRIMDVMWSQAIERPMAELQPADLAER